MQIIKPGRTHLLQECNKCKCKFTFHIKEMDTDNNIKCPECNILITTPHKACCRGPCHEQHERMQMYYIEIWGYYCQQCWYEMDDDRKIELISWKGISLLHKPIC